ncbi:MAG: nucleoside phosphorylase [bacterium]|nr:nucleoside phosphorylase [bacterium]
MQKTAMESIELLRGSHEEPAVFTAASFIRHRLGKTPDRVSSLPRYCLMGFEPAHYQRLKRRFPSCSTLSIRPGRPYLLFQFEGVPMAYIDCGIGAPASAMVLEETIELGAETCLFTGTCGALLEGIFHHDLIVPTAAVRDEGTSFHYEPPSRFSLPDPELRDALRDSLSERDLHFRESPVWTTDAPYRETAGRIRRLLADGCEAVDMESAALFSVAKSRGRRIAGLLTAVDSLAGGEWRASLPRRPEAGLSMDAVLEAGLRALRMWHHRRFETGSSRRLE